MDEFNKQKEEIAKLLTNNYIFHGTNFSEKKDIDTYKLYLDIYKKICERDKIEFEKDEKVLLEKIIEEIKKDSPIDISYLLNYEVFNGYLMKKAESLDVKELKNIEIELDILIDNFRYFIAKIITGGITTKLFEELDNNPELYGISKPEKEEKILEFTGDDTWDDWEDIVFDPAEWDIDESELDNFMKENPKPEVTKEDIKRFTEFLIIFEKLNTMINNLKNSYNDFKYYERQRQLEEYYKDEEFIDNLEEMMNHNPEEEEYRYHGTQSIKDGQAIMKTGLLMASDNLDRTSYSEFQMDQLLLYQRGGFIAQIGDKCVVIFRVPKGENIVKKINSEDYSFSQSGLGGFGNGPKYIVEPENIVGYVDKENHLVVNNPNFVKNKGISR